MTQGWRWRPDDPERADAYDRQFDALAASEIDVHGEAGFVAEFGPSSVLDAGCGTGRVAIELRRRGIDVVGVDVDAVMLDSARRKAPAIEWVESDLADLDLQRRFDVVLMAGNVMLFVHPGARPAAVAHLADHVDAAGRLVAGFSLGPGTHGGGLSLEEYDAMASDAGLELEARWATWDKAPFSSGAPYALSVHRRSD